MSIEQDSTPLKSDSERGARLILAGLVPRIDQLQTSLSELKNDFKEYCSENTKTYIGVLTRLALVEAEAKAIKDTLAIASGVVPNIVPQQPKVGPDWPKIIVAIAVGLSILLGGLGLLNNASTTKAVRALTEQVMGDSL